MNFLYSFEVLRIFSIMQAGRKKHMAHSILSGTCRVAWKPVLKWSTEVEENGDRVVQENMSHSRASGLKEKELRRPEGGKAFKICFYLVPWLAMLNTGMRISHCCFSQRFLQLPNLQSLSKAATLLFISSRELREILFVHPQGVSLLMWVSQCEGTTLESSGRKGGEDRIEILCGLRHWQVQRFACLCMRMHVRACVCVGVCVGAEESRGLRLKGGEEKLSGKAERRMERDGRLVHVGGTIWWPKVVRYTAFKCQRKVCLFKCVCILCW